MAKNRKQARQRKKAPGQSQQAVPVAADDAGQNGFALKPPLPFDQEKTDTGLVQGVFSTSDKNKFDSRASLKGYRTWENLDENIADQVVVMAEDSHNYGKLTWKEVIKKARQMANGKNKRKVVKKNEDEDNNSGEEKLEKKIKLVNESKHEKEEEKEKQINIIEKENDEEEELELNKLSIRGLFLEALKKSNIRNLKIGNKTFSETGIDLLLVESIVTDLNLKGEKFIQPKEYLKYKVTEIASCFETAGRLISLLGNPKGNTLEIWDKKSKAKEGIPFLVKDMENNSNNSCIYRIGINGVAHGFCLVLRNKSVELLQGFAGADGESLKQNIDRKGDFSIEGMTKLLMDLIQNKDPGDAMKILFGGRVDFESASLADKEEIEQEKIIENFKKNHIFQGDVGFDDSCIYGYRDMAEDVFQMERYPLYNDEELFQRITNKIKDNLKKLGFK